MGFIYNSLQMELVQMPREDTDLPFGDAFSPEQLDTEDGEPPELAVLLELADEHEGREHRFDEQIRAQFFPEDEDTTRAKNVRLGMKPNGYGITDENFRLTELGEELLGLTDDPDALYDRFAKHILQNLHGLKGIEIVEDLRARGEPTTNANLKREFRRQYDFHIDETSNHWSQMRGWMAKAGIVNARVSQYEIDRAKIEELIGVNSEDILELDGLEEHQRAFLRALAVIDPNGEIKNKHAKQLAEEAFDVSIDQSGIGRKTLDPLQEAGYIIWTHVDGKANLVEPTDKFEADVLIPILEDLAERTGVPRNVLRQSFDEILVDINSESTHERGVALETLAIKIGRMLGLDFIGWRQRGRDTDGSSVDAVMDDIGNTFNRWQIQYKNDVNQVNLNHVAQEVGIARTLQTNTVLMIAPNGTTDKALRFANRVMAHESIVVLFLSGKAIENLDEQPDHLLHALRGESRRVQNTKRLNRNDMIEGQEQQEAAVGRRGILEEYDLDTELADSTEEASLSDFTQEEEED